jgi:hypothetical protein
VSTLVDVMRQARDLGHTLSIEATASGARTVCRCSCGWHSTTRRTAEDAGGAGAHHLRLQLRSRRADGLSA